MAGGKWLELFEEVTLEEAMRDSLLYAKPGEPSLVVQLHASKKLAQEQCQELAQEKDGLSASNKDLKDKVLRLQVRTEEMTRTFRLRRLALPCGCFRVCAAVMDTANCSESSSAARLAKPSLGFLVG